jgi:hypothetical protein
MRHFSQRILEMGVKLSGQVAFDRIQAPPDYVFWQPEKRSGILAGLDDGPIRFPDEQQAPMRLD